MATGYVAAAKKAKKKPTVTVAADTAVTVNVSISPTLKGKKIWKFTLQKPKVVKKKATRTKKARTVIKWVKVKKYKTVSPTQSRIVPLVPGTYRIYVPKQNKYAKTYTPAFTFPLAVPSPASPTTPTGTGGGSSTNSTTNNTTTVGGATGGSGGGTGTGSGPGTGTGTGGTTPTAATVPSAPQGVTVTSRPHGAVVSWSPPASNGGSDIDYYLVLDSQGAVLCMAFDNATSCSLGNLVDGVSYVFLVRAVNSVGASPAASNGTPVTPASLPSPPTNVRGTPQADGTSILVSWTPADSGGSPITGYTATASPGGQACHTGGAASCLISPLSNGVPYTFTVVATTNAGSSSPSATSPAATPSRAPGQAGTPIVTAQRSPTGALTGVLVDWGDAAGNGAPITSYAVTPWRGTPPVAQSPQTVTGNPAASEILLTGLTNGALYTFRVVATNSMGAGPASEMSASFTPTTVPTAPPTIVAVSVDSGAALVTWGVVADNGGLDLAEYDVVSNIPSGGCKSSGTNPPRNCTVSGLATDTPIQFRVRARNANGYSGWSTWSLPVTPVP